MRVCIHCLPLLHCVLLLIHTHTYTHTHTALDDCAAILRGGPKNEKVQKRRDRILEVLCEREVCLDVCVCVCVCVLIYEEEMETITIMIAFSKKYTHTHIHTHTHTHTHRNTKQPSRRSW